MMPGAISDGTLASTMKIPACRETCDLAALERLNDEASGVRCQFDFQILRNRDIGLASHTDGIL